MACLGRGCSVGRGEDGNKFPADAWDALHFPDRALPAHPAGLCKVHLDNSTLLIWGGLMDGLHQTQEKLRKLSTDDRVIPFKRL